MEDKDPVGKNENAGGESSSVSGETDKNQVSYTSHQKLLGEKKKIQSEYEALRARLDEIESEKLQSQGKFKEHADTLAKKLSEAQAKERALHKTYSEKVIKQQFVTEAMKAGCIEPDDAYRLADLQGVEVTDDFSLDGDGLKSALAELQKKKPYLFQREVKGPKDRTPSNSMNKKPSSEASTDDLYKELSKLL